MVATRDTYQSVSKVITSIPISYLGYVTLLAIVTRWLVIGTLFLGYGIGIEERKT